MDHPGALIDGPQTRGGTAYPVPQRPAPADIAPGAGCPMPPGTGRPAAAPYGAGAGIVAAGYGPLPYFGPPGNVPG